MHHSFTIFIRILACAYNVNVIKILFIEPVQKGHDGFKQITTISDAR